MDSQPHLSDEVVEEILLWLPAKSLLRFKSVCRNWYALITNNSFINRHLDFIDAIISTTSRCKRKHLIRFGSITGTTIAVASLFEKEITDLEGVPSLDWEQISIVQQHGFKVNEFFNPIWGPVNGVYCILIRPLCSTVGTLVFWNPGNRDFHVLPLVPYDARVYLDTFYCCFGFDTLANDYKVIGISMYESRCTRFHLYSLATNTWKELDPFKIADPSLIDVYPDEQVVFLPQLLMDSWDGFYFRGVCHWCMEDLETTRIITFGMGLDEYFNVTYLPEGMIDGKIQSITSVDGCLGVVCPIGNDCIWRAPKIDVCVMREYGVEESWTKAYSISLHMSPDGQGMFVGIVDDEFFVKEEDGLLVSYRLDDDARDPGKELEKCEYCYVNHYHFQVLPYRESLVPLRIFEN